MEIMESTKSYPVITNKFAISGDECMVVFNDTKEVEFVTEAVTNS